MKIKIANRFRPYSHSPGVKCILPGTTCIFQIFPAMIFSDKNKIEVPIFGPVTDFTVTLDLERGCIRVWGEAKEGYFRYRIEGINEAKWQILTEKGELPFPKEGEKSLRFKGIERLALGIHKAQDWDLITRRNDLAEILPFWYRLGQMVPQLRATSSKGTLSFLSSVDYQSFLNFFSLAFEGMLVPKLEDDWHLGIKLPPISTEGLSSIPILSEGWQSIRRLFFDEGRILPNLPVQFHAGRLLDLKVNDKLFLDMEWSKKQIKKMILKVHSPMEYCFQLRKGIETFRLKKKKGDLGTRLKTSQVVSLEPGKYFLDRFE